MAKKKELEKPKQVNQEVEQENKTVNVITENQLIDSRLLNILGNQNQLIETLEELKRKLL